MESAASLPLFEHDPGQERNPLSRPPLTCHGGPLPTRCVLSFMNDALEAHVRARGCEEVDLIHSETADYPVYVDRRGARDLCLVHAPVGAPAAAIVADLLVASGVRLLAACGGCGVLSPIEQGKLLLVRNALRDEGTSYHYLAPAATVATDPGLLACGRRVLERLGLPHAVVDCWTSDGFFRETPDLVRQRQRQGWQAVDMECAALAALARHYGVAFAEVLYSGDSLEAPDDHRERDWLTDRSARSLAFQAAVEIALAAADDRNDEASKGETRGC